MVANLLNKNVYSNREGVSTETAPQIEKALANKQFAMVIFLDISGAFSNTAIHILVRSIARKGVEEELVSWIHTIQSIIRMCSLLDPVRYTEHGYGGNII